MTSTPDSAPWASDIYEQAVAAHRAGRLDEAEARYRQVLQAAPRHGGTLFLLGSLLFDKGDNDQAIKCLRQAIDGGLEEGAAFFRLGVAYVKAGRARKALRCFERSAALEPDNPASYVGLGDVRRMLGDPQAAIANYRQALQRNPASAEAKAGLGAALMDAGRPEEAIAPLSEALAGAPDSAAAHMNLAAALMASGEAARAVDLYRKACALAPDLAAAQVGLGTALEAQGRLEEAAKAYEAGLERSPGHADTLAALGRALNRLKRYEGAISALQQAIGEGAGSAAAWAELVTAHAELGQIGDAREAARQGLQHHPGNSQILAALGDLNARVGDFDESEQCFRQVLEREPDNVSALFGLMTIRRTDNGQVGIDAIEELLAASSPNSQRAAYLHAILGRLLEKAERYDEAFRHFEAAGEAMAAHTPFDRDAYAAGTDAIVNAFDATVVEALMGSGSSSELLVFVTGMPRSGTTLVEQLLASHPHVYGAGELDLLPGIAEALPVRAGLDLAYPACMARLKGGVARACADAYLEELGQRAGEPALVTDKSISTYRYLGLAAGLFPKARFIHCRRDPLDTCLSCFQHIFSGAEHGYSYRLADLGLVYGEYLRLMSHWRTVLPVEMLEVDYEALVADQEGETRRILEFCGLPWDDACLTFHRTARPVKTSSVWQVRQPIYGSAVGRWKRYARHLEPLRDEIERLSGSSGG